MFRPTSLGTPLAPLETSMRIRCRGEQLGPLQPVKLAVGQRAQHRHRLNGYFAQQVPEVFPRKQF